MIFLRSVDAVVRWGTLLVEFKPKARVITPLISLPPTLVKSGSMLLDCRTAYQVYKSVFACFLYLSNPVSVLFKWTFKGYVYLCF